jgi:uncharacterized protein YbjT (DUF2867 family)
VVGATGTVGREVTAQLLAAGARVRALTRTPASSAFPAEVEVVAGDLTRPETLDPALEGVRAVFLVWVAPGATAVPVLERVARRAPRVVFLSAPIKTPHPFFQQPNPVRALAEHVERAIETSGVSWTFLRPGMFAANSVGFWAGQIRAGDRVRWPFVESPTAPIDPRDIAAVAVRALSEDGHQGAEYVMTGPEALTQREQIETIGRALGRTLLVEDVSREEALRGPLAAFPPAAASMLMDAWSAALGHPALVTGTVAEVLGRPPRTFFEWARDHASEFQG